MKNKLIMLVMFVLISAQVHAFTIDATVTADNNYALYHGNQSGTSLSYVGRNEATDAGSPGQFNWSEAESFSFSVNTGDYLYIAAWSDDNIAQGLLGQFGSILTDSSWEYYLTFQDKDINSAAPTISELAVQIAAANLSGWTQVTNTADHAIQSWGWNHTVAGISLDADWIWGSSMHPGSNYGEYQIFRKGVPEPGTMFLLGSLATGLFGFAGLRKRFTK